MKSKRYLRRETMSLPESFKIDIQPMCEGPSHPDFSPINMKLVEVNREGPEPGYDILTFLCMECRASIHILVSVGAK